MVARSGTRVGSYVLGSSLAARVWTASPPDGAAVVIKLPEAPDAARREAASLAAVHHPHLVELLDIVDTDRGPALVLPRVLCSLADLVSSRGPLPPGEVVTLGVAIGGALHALHQRGLVHGDVHPGNVLIAAGGVPVLADLDLAGPPAPPAGATPGFVAPELALGEATSSHSDQWALAATCAAALGPAMPTPLAVVLAVASAERPADRFSDLVAFVAALGRTVEAQPITVPEATTAAEPRRSRAPANGIQRVATPTTRRFGPRPPRPAPPRRGPGPFAVAALAAFAVAVGLVAPRVFAASPGDAPAPSSSACTEPTSIPGDRPLGGGCALQRGDLLVVELAGEEHTFRLGQPGDVFVLGDWDCSGTRTAAAYRPATGDVFEWSSWSTGAAPSVATHLAAGGEPVVRRSAGGCDTVALR